LLYAVVDIETTGGYAAANGITEIAIRITDGKNILRHYDTLLNPIYSIPPYVQTLTGITNEMVSGQRKFSDVAQELYQLLHDKVFVAHNVNFDYSFVKHHLRESGYDLNSKKLCTIRLGRQVIPGLKKYGLGNFCRSVGIDIEQRHRAGGDADATVKLFHHLLTEDRNGHAEKMLKGKNNEQYLPPNLESKYLKRIPYQPGVYYFHDKKGKIIYVGKAKNLYKRVNSHFANNKPNKQKQEFLKNIYSISYKVCATELMAFILESVEIKKLWPQQNRSQKRFEHSYALYSFEDSKGYMRLAIEKKNKSLPCLYSFNLLVEGHTLLRRLSHQFSLCPKLCYLQHDNIECVGQSDNRCKGTCDHKEAPAEYNKRVTDCIEQLNVELPTFALIDTGLYGKDKSCIVMEKGRFYGMGYLPKSLDFQSLETIKEHLTPYNENDYIRGLVYQHVAKYPEKKIVFA
jgi:DNA polymerase III subunit epsilon